MRGRLRNRNHQKKTLGQKVKQLGKNLTKIWTKTAICQILQRDKYLYPGNSFNYSFPDTDEELKKN